MKMKITMTRRGIEATRADLHHRIVIILLKEGVHKGIHLGVELLAHIKLLIRLQHAHLIHPLLHQVFIPMTSCDHLHTNLNIIIISSYFLLSSDVPSTL